MELCESCAGIQRNWRKAPGHPELVQGNNRAEKRGNHLATVTQYRCDRCGTAWEYENDKSNLKAGWSVGRQSARPVFNARLGACRFLPDFFIANASSSRSFPP